MAGDSEGAAECLRQTTEDLVRGKGIGLVGAKPVSFNCSRKAMKADHEFLDDLGINHPLSRFLMSWKCCWTISGANM